MVKGKDECRMMNDEFFCGEDFTGETVRVVREKDIRLYGEYRTPRIVLEAWDGQSQQG
jgi:hypothetical protein